MSLSTQKIFRIRREYNAWVANESLEDYALRYTPRSFRKWSEWQVANTAFGAVSFLALEAIGGFMALNYGFTNAFWAILAVGLITFLTALPISYYAAHYGLDMDLLTRGAGFGYLGSTFTSLVYASFTFIFLALEAAILAHALELFFRLPLVLCYLVSSLVIIPLVTHGITLISRLQAWTQPLWLVLLMLPYVAVLWKNPQVLHDVTTLTGRTSGSSSFSWVMFAAACTVAFSLVVQVGEQVDYLRFLPKRTPQNRVRWWAAVLVAGPGWIFPGMLKMLGGVLLAFLALQVEISPAKAVEPVHMYLAGFSYVFDDPAWVLTATTVFVVVSQIKINVTNAYAGSLAWSNFFARLTHNHPGRVVWLVFNVLIALLLTTLGIFQALERVLGVYSNIAIAWVGALVADLVINKPLGLSPRHVEFKRAYLYDINPVGLGAMAAATVAASAAYLGLFGDQVAAFAPFIALAVALVASPLLAHWTRGRYYIARPIGGHWRPGQAVACSVCENTFESEDMATCPAYDAPICSLCCTLESRCRDRCKTASGAGDQFKALLARWWPASRSLQLNFRVGHYLVVLVALSALLMAVMGVVYFQESLLTPHHPLDAARAGLLQGPFIKLFAMLMLIAAVCAWWIVLGSESRRMAQDESNRQNTLLVREIEAHRLTDTALQAAKEAAEAANQAKTRYVTGMTHELRTPLNSILGYTQILLKDAQLRGGDSTALATIHRSGEHLLSLIDGLLDLARIEAGRLRLDPAPVPLREFLDDVARMVRPQAEAKALHFTMDVRGRLPSYVQIDARRLRQILINLLSNAVRFTDRGSITLQLDFRREVARIAVIDTGIGIAPQDQERIFLPFERGSAGRRSGDPGTGLGLTITHLLTELMGGQLSVSSQPGAGSTFTVRVYLPETASPGPTPRLYRPVTGYVGPRRTLLLVDDQPIQRQLLAGMLAPLGFRIREAASGRECVESVRAHCPDALLLDVSMDDIDGWETARRLRGAGFTALPIVMVSANVFENRPDKLDEVACQGFLDKPVIESELLAMLEKLLQIEWVAQAPPVQWSDAGAVAPPALPPDAVSDLVRLARMGHVQGLRTALAGLSTSHPGHDAYFQQLAERLDRFEIDGLLDLLHTPGETDAA